MNAVVPGSSWRLAGFLALAVLGFVPPADAQSETSPNEPLTFNRDIRPILAAACFRCHGLDANHREAGLRLDLAESAKAPGSDGTAIVPGDRSQSLMWQRILSGDEDSVMPPPTAARQLTPEEKEILGRWIDQGAPYEKHWAFEPIVAPKFPVQWESEDPIDHFLMVEMKRHGLKPNGPADPRTLVRRLAFALTGLPPEVEDVEAFAASPTDEAYAALVDRYLRSPHYGEEMAKHWLDLARYGDTHGLHLDNDRMIWPYRDWVAAAFQSNMPFDRFTIEQLAGDLLPNPTQSQWVATGFNRCNVTTSEGGAIDDEFLFRYAVDRTSTTISTWLGMTGGCAVCHDHKYDPLTMKDFYSLYSFFYSAGDPAMDGNISRTAPFMKLPTKEQQEALNQLDAKEVAAREALMRVALDWVRVGARDEVKKRPVTQVVLDDELPLGAGQRNTSRNEMSWSEPGVVVPMGRRALVTRFGDKFEQVVTSPLVPCVLPEAGQVQVWIQADRLEPPDALFLEIKTNQGTRRWVWADDPELARRVDASPDRVIGPMPPPGRWTLATISLDGLAPGAIVQEWKVGLFGGIASWDGLVVSGLQRTEDTLRHDPVAWWNHRKGQSTPFATHEVATAIKDGPESDSGRAHRDGVLAYFTAMIAADVPPEVEQARAQWNAIRIERMILDDSIPGTMIFKERAEPRQAHVMTRGQYDAKGEPVRPRTPSFLPNELTSTDGKRLNRLDLANWLVDRSNPLVARVAVNRFWQQMFGVGFVKTSDDFGSQGTPPSHPELLDYLASEFRDGGWDVQRLLRRIVMSDAFRRDSKFHGDVGAIDPENRYLARGPRLRLDAEQIRDNALAVSGLLQRTIGGPGFLGYQPPNIWEPVGYGDSNTRYYLQDHGDSLYRRSLYAYIKRTAPPPFLSNFDAPNRETACTRRERSNTPLQALQLMNDVQHFEAARMFAERILRECPSTVVDADHQRIGRAFLRALGRLPDEHEYAELQQALARFRARLEQQADDATKIARVGERWPATDLAPAEVATWALLCNLILNLDETVTRN